MPPNEAEVVQLECEFCGTLQNEDDLNHNQFDQFVCEDCLNDDVRSCDNCRWWTRFTNEWWLVDMPDSMDLCDDCAAETYRCDNCGDCAMREGTFVWVENLQAHLCGYCEEDQYERRRGESLYSWNYRPEFRLIADESEEGLQVATYHFGVELETDHVDEYAVAQAVHSNIPNAYCKSDGSLERGVEIVTHPGTLLAWQNGHVIPWGVWEQVNAHFTDMCEMESAGIHIHVSRTAFERNGNWSAAHLWKFMQLHYRNSFGFAKLAGRMGSSYASWNPAGDRVIAKKNARRNDHDDRYRVININNDATVECRYFQADERKHIILKNIELVHAAIEYTRTLKATDVVSGMLGFRYFHNWYMQRPMTYPNLRLHTLEMGTGFVDSVEERAARDDEVFRRQMEQEKEDRGRRREVRRVFRTTEDEFGGDPYVADGWFRSDDHLREWLANHSRPYFQYVCSDYTRVASVAYNVIRSLSHDLVRTMYANEVWEERNYYDEVTRPGTNFHLLTVWYGWMILSMLQDEFGIADHISEDEMWWLNDRINGFYPRARRHEFLITDDIT